MDKTVLILCDGMADEPLHQLGGKTPVEYAPTPHMDAIAAAGACGTFLSLPGGFPTSSDVANMSVLGYDLATHYCGRGPVEAVSQGIELQPDDIACRCNLVYADGDVLVDYSAGHIPDADARQLMATLKDRFDSADYTFHAGVSYRNLLILHGPQFSEALHYHKADAAHGMKIPEILLQPADESAAARRTAAAVNDLMLRARPVLEAHAVNAGREAPANMIWVFSPGRRPRLEPFRDRYGARGAIISAVDVIFGLGMCAGMTPVRVPGATGFVDTNYEGKADAAVRALDDHDFVYVHVEAADECSHLGDLELKLKAIADIDRRLIGRLREQLAGRNVTYAVLPDHPVPLRLRLHTRTPVPVAVAGRHIRPDATRVYGEAEAERGALGRLAGDQLIRLVLGRN